MLPKNVRLTGRNPLAYLGVDPTTPPLLLVEKRSPTANDYSNVNIGAIWVVSEDETQTYEYWVLVNLDSGAAHWVQLYPGASGGATSIPADVGTATVASGVLKIYGGENITTTGSGDEIDIALDDSVSINTALTVKALGAGVILSDTNGRFSSTDGNDGMVLIGNTSGAPEWANITAGANVSITNGANSITISASGGGGGGDLTFAGDTGTALADAGSMTIQGDSTTISTVASGTGATAKLVISALSSPSFTNVTTQDITVTGQPTFSGLSDGFLMVSSGVVSSSSSATNGAVLIASDSGPALWKQITAGSGVTITNSPNKILIAATGGGGSGVTFTGTTGTTAATTTLKIIGANSNITTVASGSGTASQVAISIASAPTFTSLTTTNLTVPGTLTLSSLTSGVLKVSGTGAVIADTPTANGQVLIASSTGTSTWGTITGVGTVSVTNGANSITITGSATTRTWTKITTLFGGAKIWDICAMQNYFVVVADGHIAYSTDPSTASSWHSATYSDAVTMRSCCTDGKYVLIPIIRSDSSVAFYYTTNPTYGFSLNQMSSSWHSNITPFIGRSSLGFSIFAASNMTNQLIGKDFSAPPVSGGGTGYNLYNPYGAPSLNIVASSYSTNTTGFIASNGVIYTSISGNISPSYSGPTTDTNYRRMFYSPKSAMAPMYNSGAGHYITTSTSNQIIRDTAALFPLGATIYAATCDGNTFMAGGLAFYKSTDLSTFIPLSASGGTIPANGITAMANAGGTWIAGDAAGQIWALVE